MLHLQIYGLVCGLPYTTFHCCLGVLVTSPLFIWGSWVLPNSLIILFASWKGKFGNTNSRDIWVVVPLYLMWCLWREVNSSYFWRERVSGDPAEVSFSQGCIRNFEWKSTILCHFLYFGSWIWYEILDTDLYSCFFYVYFFSFGISFVYSLCTRVGPLLSVFTQFQLLIKRISCCIFTH